MWSKEEKLKRTETNLVEIMLIFIHSNGNRIHSFFPVKLAFSIGTQIVTK